MEFHPSVNNFTLALLVLLVTNITSDRVCTICTICTSVHNLWWHWNSIWGSGESSLLTAHHLIDGRTNHKTEFNCQTISVLRRKSTWWSFSGHGRFCFTLVTKSAIRWIHDIRGMNKLLKNCIYQCIGHNRRYMKPWFFKTRQAHISGPDALRVSGGDECGVDWKTWNSLHLSMHFTSVTTQNRTSKCSCKQLITLLKRNSKVWSLITAGERELEILQSFWRSHGFSSTRFNLKL